MLGQWRCADEASLCGNMISWSIVQMDGRGCFAIDLSVRLSVYQSDCPSISLSACLTVLFVFVSVWVSRLSVWLPIWLSFCGSCCPSACPTVLFACVSVFLSPPAYPSVCFSLHLSVSLSVCLQIHLSISPSVSPPVCLSSRLSLTVCLPSRLSFSTSVALFDWLFLRCLFV